MKPMLATNWEETEVRFPLIAQPKIDGVRALNIDGKLFARSLKPFKNVHAMKHFSQSFLTGLDGEMIVGTDPTSPSLCRDTTSALNSIAGAPRLTWYLFDMFTPGIINRTYLARYRALEDRLGELGEGLRDELRLVPCKIVHDMDELTGWDRVWLDEGYEGTILRDPHGFYKQGRSTVNEGGLLRIKAFIEEEILITRVEEGQTNNNPVTINELGRTARSTHQVNMVPNGQVGNIFGTLLKDVTWRGKTIFRKGEEIKIAAGCLTQAERKYYWQNQGKIRGQIAKFQFFPQGQKDKPRFPTFQSFRMKEDR